MVYTFPNLSMGKFKPSESDGSLLSYTDPEPFPVAFLQLYFGVLSNPAQTLSGKYATLYPE
jgi:hypothetical protein